MGDMLEQRLTETAAVCVCWLEAMGMDQATVLWAVSRERAAQDETWGVDREQSAETWLAILAEAFGEVAKAVNEGDDE